MGAVARSAAWACRLEHRQNGFASATLRLHCFYTQTRQRTGARTRRLRLLSARTKLRTLRPPCARHKSCLHVILSPGTVLNTILLLTTCSLLRRFGRHALALTQKHFLCILRKR